MQLKTIIISPKPDAITNFRDSISEPFPPELKGSPGFESVTTVYKNALSNESDDNAGGNVRQAHASGTAVYFLFLAFSLNISL